MGLRALLDRSRFRDNGDDHLTFATPWDREENLYYLVKRERPQLLILDIRIKNRDEGWKLLEQVRLDPATTHIPAIVCSGDAQLLRWKRRHLRTLGIAALEKPFRLEDLLHEIRTILEPRG
jgi:CheY-like chemotaxis protein